MHRFCLFLARTSITLWVGAAILFVVVGVSEVIHAGFGSEIRDQLVVIRFPWYYRFGMVLITTSLIGTLGSGAKAELSQRRKVFLAALIAVALFVFVVEYFTIYVRLAELVTPPGKPRTPEFISYHRTTMWVNLLVLTLCSAAMCGLNWPAKSAGGETTRDE